MADNVITNLSIEVTASADKAASMFDRLASSAGRLKGAASGAAGGMQDMAQGARDAGTATQEAGTQAGRARPNIRGVGKDAKDAGDNAKKGSKGIEFFWNQLKRVALYRVIRSVIREITDAFKTGITNLYHWSDLVNGHFAASMDRLATSSQYLKNSLGAMVSPLIETLVPVLDVIIDKVVDVLNFFNMLVSAVSGADTYTVAKKAAAVWDDSSKKTRSSAKKAADDIKRTILGFDEINKLVKPNSSTGSSGSSSTKKQPNYAEMFEEKPLTGIFKKISDVTNGWPDWLKALLGVGAFALPIFGIPALLKTIWDWLKKLFSINIPDWFRWLFGPKGNGNGNGIDLPDNIKLPDADVKVNLDTDDIEEVKVPVSTTPTGDELFKDLRHDWNKNKTTLFMNDKLLDSGDELFKKFRQEWNKNKTTLFVSVLLLKTGEELFKALRSLWNKNKTTLFVDVRLLKTGDELFKDFRSEWNTAKTTLFVNDKLLDSADELFKEFRGEWNKVKTTLFVNDKLLDSADELFKEFRHEWNTIKTTLFVSNQLLKTGEDLFSAFHREWESAKSTLYASVDLVKKWSGSAIYALGLDNINATASIDAYAQWWHMGIMRYLGLDDIDATAWVDVMTPWWYYGKSVLEWLGLNNLSTTVTVYTRTVSSGFGGATGGGGSVRGGGAGRGRKAKGGIFANGLWSSIPQYAGGTAGVNHGSLFWAGENGAEIVGNAGGRTEVLNKSQIASAMFSAVQAAMAPAAANFAEAAANMGVAETGFDFETLADMVRQGVEQAMSRANDYDRQKVELLRSINDKDFNVDVSTASINKAQSRMNRRAGVTIAPVGT